MPDRAQMHQVTESEDWKSLMNQLQDYVQNFRQKLVEARAGFQF
jgi:hypothetical protein